MDIVETANNICNYFMTISEVNSVSIYGSIAKHSYDRYSDIDVELDLSGSDNGLFFLRLVELLNNVYPVIFSDYAPSLLPDNYIVSCAISEENPFLIVDIKCSATPHINSVKKCDIINDKYAHILKLWVANIKHYLRGSNCKSDIERMYHKLFVEENRSEKQMLCDVFAWLQENKTNKYEKYLLSCEKYIRGVNGGGTHRTDKYGTN